MCVMDLYDHFFSALSQQRGVHDIPFKIYPGQTKLSAHECALHSQKLIAHCITGLNNVVQPTLFRVVNNSEQY